MIPSVLIQKSTKSILRYALYPRAEITPFLEGELDPDLEWLVIYTPYAEPDYDPRIYLLVTNYPNLEFLSSFPDHPDYPGIKAYQITYTPEKRSKEEIIVSIDNAQKEANSLVWSESEHKDKQILMMQAALKASTGAILNSYEQSLLNEMSEVVVKLSKNNDNRSILVSMVNAGLEPNIDSGWERN